MVRHLERELGHILRVDLHNGGYVQARVIALRVGHGEVGKLKTAIGALDAVPEKTEEQLRIIRSFNKKVGAPIVPRASIEDHTT